MADVPTWTPTMLPSASASQYWWFLASTVHALLFLLLLAVGPGAGAGNQDEDQRTTDDVVVLVAPPKREESKARTAVGGPAGGAPLQPPGLNIELDRMSVSIAEDPGYELLEVLRRQRGLFGVCESACGAHVVYVDRILDAVQGRREGDVTTHRLDDYFAVRLIDMNVWLRAAGGVLEAEIGSADAVFALFPQSFGAKLAAAIRELAVQKGLTAVHAVTIRFDRRAPRGIVLEEIA